MSTDNKSTDNNKTRNNSQSNGAPGHDTPGHNTSSHTTEDSHRPEESRLQDIARLAEQGITVARLTAEVQAHLTRLFVPVPPMLESALGYSGEARYVGFYWEVAGDELAWADGRTTLVGANWHAWIIYARHKAVLPHLLSWNFGSSEIRAQHVLVLDRSSRIVYAGDYRIALMLLTVQHGPAPHAPEPHGPAPHTPEPHGPAPHTPEQCAIDSIALEAEDAAAPPALLKALEASEWKTVPSPEMEELQRAMEEQHAREDALAAWLDKHAASMEAFRDPGRSNDADDYSAYSEMS